MKLKIKDVHTLSVLVANKPGVLARIAQVFARRTYNINSLVVSPAVDALYSRMTLTVKGDPEMLDQVIKQISKLVDVLHCFEHTGTNSVVRELVLVKIEATSQERTEILQISEHFVAKSVDFTENSIVLMCSGNTDKIDAMIKLLTQFKIIELVRTGKVVMARGKRLT